MMAEAKTVFGVVLMGKVCIAAPFQERKAKPFPARPYRPESVAQERFSLSGSEQAVIIDKKYRWNKGKAFICPLCCGGAIKVLAFITA
jgi:hypothetical protein